MLMLSATDDKPHCEVISADQTYFYSYTTDDIAITWLRDETMKVLMKY